MKLMNNLYIDVKSNEYILKVTENTKQLSYTIFSAFYVLSNFWTRTIKGLDNITKSDSSTLTT